MGEGGLTYVILDGSELANHGLELYLPLLYLQRVATHVDQHKSRAPGDPAPSYIHMEGDSRCGGVSCRGVGPWLRAHLSLAFSCNKDRRGQGRGGGSWDLFSETISPLDHRRRCSFWRLLSRTRNGMGGGRGLEPRGRETEVEVVRLGGAGPGKIDHATATAKVKIGASWVVGAVGQILSKPWRRRPCRWFRRAR